MPKSDKRTELWGSKDIDGTGKPEVSLLKSRLEANLARKSELCSALEDMADRLPFGVGPDYCRSLIKVLQPTLLRAHSFEEQSIFPLVVKHFPDIEETLNRLCNEHIDDDSFASEIEDSLFQMFKEPTGANIDSLSYMLRGFFAGLRRHIAFEQEHIVPLLTEISTKT